MRTKITEEIITKICDLYKRGLTQKQIANELNIGKTTVSRYLKKNNIKIRNPFKFDLIEKDKICKDYMEGLSEEKLATKYNSNRTTIRNVLKEFGVERRDNSEYRFYSIKENYFDEIDVPNKAYILGFLYADGNVSKNKYNIQLSLQEGDFEILDKIKTEIGSTAPLEYRNFKKYNEKYNTNTQNQWCLSLHCKKMWESLGKHGVTPKKTHEIEYPNFLKDDLHKHFLRGVLDGDGCIHAPYGKNGKIKNVDICGTKNFCNGTKKIIENILDIHCSVIKTCNDPNKTTYRLTVSGGKQVSKFLDWIYEDADLKLNRKYQLYLKYYCNNNKLKTA